jgi:hypothetical protein
MAGMSSLVFSMIWRLPMHIVNLQCINSHALANTYSVLTHTAECAYRSTSERRPFYPAFGMAFPVPSCWPFYLAFGMAFLVPSCWACAHSLALRSWQYVWIVPGMAAMCVRHAECSCHIVIGSIRELPVQGVPWDGGRHQLVPVVWHATLGWDLLLLVCRQLCN